MAEYVLLKNPSTMQTLFKKSWTLDSYGGRTIHSRTTVLRNALLVAPLRKENPLNAMLRQGVVRLVSYLSTIVGLKITTLRVALIGTNRYYVTNAGKGHKRTDCLLKVNRVATYNKTKCGDSPQKRKRQRQRERRRRRKTKTLHLRE